MENTGYFFPPFVPGDDSIPLTLPQGTSVTGMLPAPLQLQGSSGSSSALSLRPQTFPQNQLRSPLSLPASQSATRNQPQPRPRPQIQSHNNQQEQPSRAVTKKSVSGFTIACANCRSKKIKVGNTVMPYSKRYIRDLQQRIEDLEKALRESEQCRIRQQRDLISLTGLNQFSGAYHTGSFFSKKPPSTIILRLCDGRYQMDGKQRSFGPTSSLHLTVNVTEDPTWSIIEAWGERSTESCETDNFELDSETQNYLLNLYWKYQHTELQVFHKEAFLRDMSTGKSGFYSKALLYCILSCAARISHRPEIRALVLPSHSSGQDPQQSGTEQRPLLFTAASRLLEQELRRPQITTISSLLLLSVIYCASSQDTRGLSLTGTCLLYPILCNFILMDRTACRLALKLELHRDCSHLNLPQMDVEARQIAFWGCVVFDRLWGLYLGRECFLRLDETVTIPRPGQSQYAAPWNCLLAGAWSSLLELVGLICENLNHGRCNMAQVNQLGDRLHHWYIRLDPSLHYQKNGSPSVAVMHMQYSAAIILLYRPLADFGKEGAEKSEYSNQFRLICLQHSFNITNYLTDYRNYHGNATTLSGVALHIISQAAITFIAEISERRNTDVSNEYMCLAVCVQTLLELEQTYLVAQQVRKLLKKIVRLCNLEDSRLKPAAIMPNDRIGSSLGYASSARPAPSSRITVMNELNDDDEYEDDAVSDEVLLQRLQSLPPDQPTTPEPANISDIQLPSMPYTQYIPPQDLLSTYASPPDPLYQF
ncbi:hypothetical protein FQN50_002062 [Emmonsiellopsis sp. PD_5]|nr:hypothetical protein FQN50_002062 [Emmonsiellopsis sp. PD_5]